MKIQDAKSSGGEELYNLENYKAQVIKWVYVIESNPEFPKHVHKYKGRVVLRRDYVKDESYTQVFNKTRRISFPSGGSHMHRHCRETVRNVSVNMYTGINERWTSPF